MPKATFLGVASGTCKGRLGLQVGEGGVDRLKR